MQKELTEQITQKRERVKSHAVEIFSLHDNMADPEVIHNSIESGAQIHGSNMCILILAIIIASIGLNMNSTAVIIGAMLISPLMNGIMAMGYGVATNDIPLVKKAASGFGIQVLICIVTSTLYFVISPISTTSSELLARTSPTIWDVIIAICGGIAGAIGSTRKEKTNVIPGVAIATALMPPLCTAGYGIATGNLKFFLGAFYLFFINCFFIALSTLVVIFILIPEKRIINEKAKKKITSSMIFISVIIIIPSVFIAWGIVADTVTTSKYNSYINNEFEFDNTQIVQSSIDIDEKTISVALIGSVISDDIIDMLETKLGNYNLSDYTLNITQTTVSEGITPEQLQSIIDSQIDADNSNFRNLLLQEEADRLQRELDEANKALEEYHDNEVNLEELCEKIKIVFPEIKNCSIGIHYGKINNENGFENIEYLLATAETETPMSDEVKGYINNWLSSESGYEHTAVIAYITEDMQETVSETSSESETVSEENTDTDEE